MPETELESRRETSAPRPTAEQRRHRRVPANIDVQTSWIDGFGAEVSAPAVVKDISAGGFCIEAVYKRPVGSRLTVTSTRHSMQCVVRHVQSHNGWFYHGLEIVPLLVEAATDRSLHNLGSALSHDSAGD
jgi:hypothetical protein